MLACLNKLHKIHMQRHLSLHFISASPTWHTPCLCSIHQGGKLQSVPYDPSSGHENSTLTCGTKIWTGCIHQPMLHSSPTWSWPPYLRLIKDLKDSNPPPQPKLAIPSTTLLYVGKYILPYRAWANIPNRYYAVMLNYGKMEVFFLNAYLCCH